MFGRLTLGLPASGSAEDKAEIAPFLNTFRSRAGFEVEPVFLDHDAMLKRGAGIDLLWSPPLVAIALTDLRAHKPLVVCGRKGGVHYFAAFVTKKSSTRLRTADLRGASMAWVSRTSAAGYLVPRLYLQSKGFDPASMFAHETFAASHEAALTMVHDGRAEVAAVFVEPLADGAYRLPLPSPDTRVVSVIGPIPSDVISARVGLDPTAQQAAQGALLGMSDLEVRGLSRIASISCFEPVPHGHLDPLARLVHVVRRTSTPRMA